MFGPEILQIPAQVLKQLQTGEVWTHRDFVKNYEGLRFAVDNAGSSRGLYATAIFGLMAFDDLLVRTGAVAVLDAAAPDLEPDHITMVLQANSQLFRGFFLVVTIAFADLEWAAVAAYQGRVTAKDSRTIAYFREIAQSQNWRAFVLAALARLDGEWVVAHAALVPHDNFAVLWALNPDQRRRLIREILGRQGAQGWGAKVIDQLSADLRAAFPEMKGLSASNLKYMRFFAQECPEFLIGQQSADQLPWFHIVTIITKLADPVLRDWYAREALQRAWGRETLGLSVEGASAVVEAARRREVTPRRRRNTPRVIFFSRLVLANASAPPGPSLFSVST